MSERGPCLACDKPTEGLYCDACRQLPFSELADRVIGNLEPSPAPLLEADTQHDVVKALKLAGWSVWRVGQRNAKGTMDPGVSDLICCRERVVFCEMKREEGGVQSEDQAKFQLAIERANGEYRIARGIDDVRDMLERPR